jgi:hypothetical protein
MFGLKVISFFFVCVLAGCENSILQTNNTNQSQQTKEQKLSLRMERTGCYGTCPVYNLNVESNGKVLFEGKFYTKTTGKIESDLSKEKINQLITEIDIAGFFGLKDSYTGQSGNCPTTATDSSTVTVSIKLNEKEKTIIHYLGCQEDIKIGEHWKIFPQELYNLENKIDEIVETKRWVGERK